MYSGPRTQKLRARSKVRVATSGAREREGRLWFAGFWRLRTRSLREQINTAAPCTWTHLPSSYSFHPCFHLRVFLFLPLPLISSLFTSLSVPFVYPPSFPSSWRVILTTLFFTPRVTPSSFYINPYFPYACHWYSCSIRSSIVSSRARAQPIFSSHSPDISHGYLSDRAPQFLPPASPFQSFFFVFQSP